MKTTFALESQVHFLGEKRTKLYEKYCLGASQVKNVLGSKSTSTNWALPELIWGGA